MTTIVMNTLTGAVSEYDWAFQSITPTHAGDVSGLYALGGDTDNEQPIAAEVTTGKCLRGDSRRTAVGKVYLSMQAEGETCGIFHVHGQTASWCYDLELQADGVSCVDTGMGIYENYLGFGYTNPAGEAFRIDRIEIPLIKSNTRRT